VCAPSLAPTLTTQPSHLPSTKPTTERRPSAQPSPLPTLVPSPSPSLTPLPSRVPTLTPTTVHSFLLSCNPRLREFPLHYLSDACGSLLVNFRQHWLWIPNEFFPNAVCMSFYSSCLCLSLFRAQTPTPVPTLSPLPTIEPTVVPTSSHEPSLGPSYFVPSPRPTLAPSVIPCVCRPHALDSAPVEFIESFDTLPALTCADFLLTFVAQGPF
jgi:hypothetical protein